MAWVGLRVPLEKWLGPIGASRFTDEDLRRLWEGGYETLEDLQIASHAGLEQARLRPARADQIIHAQGAAAGTKRAVGAGAAAGLGVGSAAVAGNDEQRSAAQLLRSPLPDSDVHPVTWKAAHTSGQIYEMKADDVQHWEYVQPEQEAAGGGEGGACSGNAGNGQQLLVDAIRDHQDQADELYGRDLRLLRPQCVGSIDSEADAATAMASAVTGARALGVLANAFLRLNRVATGIRAIWRQQPPSAIIQGSMITGGPARPVYGQQAPAAGPAAAAAAGPAAAAAAGPAAAAAAGSAAAGAGSAAAAAAGPAAAAGSAAAAAAGSAAAVASAVAAPSSSAVDYRYKQDLLMTTGHVYDVNSSSSGCGISADVGDVVTPQMVEPAASAGGSGWQGHATGSQDQQQQQQLLEATLVPPPCAPPQARPMTAGAPDVQQQQQVAGDCQGGGGSAVGGSACFQQLEATAQVEAGPAAKRRRVQPKCVCAGELEIISKLMVGKGQPLDLREAWRDDSHPRHAIAVAVLSQILTYMIARGICYGFISCWLATWLVYCPPAGADGCRRRLLYVSDPFLSTTSAAPAPGDAGGRSRAATVYGALAFLQWRALRRAVCLQEPLQHMGMDTSPTGMGPATDGGGGAGGGGAGAGGNDSSAEEPDAGARTGSDEQYTPTQSELEQASDSYHQLQGSLQQLGRQGTAAAEPAGAVVAAQQRQPQQMPAAAPGTVADAAAAPAATAAAAAATAGAANLPRPSRVLLRFSETLAAGSEGLVMAGTCDGVDCVIKLLGPDRSGLAAYEREVAAYAALQRLQGRHVPELQAWGDLEYGVRFLALRRVAGAQPLSSLQRPLPAAVAGAALQALEVVQAACPGFVHGDVRLENVVVLEAAASGGLRGEQQLPAGLAGPSTSQPAGASAGARDEARGGVAARAASSGSLLLPRCVLLDFGRSRLDGDAAQQRLEREELRQLLR